MIIRDDKKYIKLKEEIEIENTSEKFVEFNNKEKNELERIKFETEKEGIPYQTFITSILHKYTTHQLVDEKIFIKLKELFVH